MSSSEYRGVRADSIIYSGIIAAALANIALFLLAPPYVQIAISLIAFCTPILGWYLPFLIISLRARKYRALIVGIEKRLETARLSEKDRAELYLALEDANAAVFNLELALLPVGDDVDDIEKRRAEMMLMVKATIMTIEGNLKRGISQPRLTEAQSLKAIVEEKQKGLEAGAPEPAAK